MKYCVLFLLLLLIVLVVCLATMNHSKYLNYNSTASPEFNYSDLLYPETEYEREQVEQMKAKIMGIVNAPVGSKCIINSGATESIASCVNWARNYIPRGVIVGSKYDHSAIEANAKAYDMKYARIDIESDELPDNSAAVFISQVNGSTGEYLNVRSVASNIDSTSILMEGGSADADRVLQYKPLRFLDATQSFGKLKIDMERDKLNAVFFSLHKLGGEQGLGVMIVNDYKFPEYTPLIAGEQQKGLRGGTLPIQHILDFQELFGQVDDLYARKEVWEDAYNQLKNSGLDVYTPTHSHLYSTLLINTKNKCSKQIISNLADKGIYVGAKSACALEGGGDAGNVIRISFRKPEELDRSTLNKIIGELH